MVHLRPLKYLNKIMGIAQTKDNLRHGCASICNLQDLHESIHVNLMNGMAGISGIMNQYHGMFVRYLQNRKCYDIIVTCGDFFIHKTPWSE